ncbi:MAG: membrane protein insertase YidC [Candidatus Methylacidiphilales bacterium]
MDRTSWIAVIVCFVLLLFYQQILFFFFPEWAKPAPSAPSIPPSAQEQPVSRDSLAPLPPEAGRESVMISGRDESTYPASEGPEVLETLSNALMHVTFTNLGGAIHQVSLIEHKAQADQPVVLNAGGSTPILTLSGWKGAGRSLFTQTTQTADSITYERVLSPGVRLERRYRILPDGYQIEYVQTVYTDYGSPVVMPPYTLSMGTFSPIYNLADERRFVGMAWHTPSPGGSYKDKSMTSFDAGFMGMSQAKSEISSKEGESIQWAALKTQFFTLILNLGETPGSRLYGIHERLSDIQSSETQSPDGIRGEVEIPGFQVNASYSKKFTLYAGPKEDHRLRKMGMEEDRLMEFGIFGVISRPMLMLMNGINHLVNNYGISIILMTVILRGILWYPQTKANLSMKRMQTVAPLMKELQEKFKDKPEKMNQEMMKLYQDYGVNPFGGCLPLLVQFPIFLGFYYMLLASIELRHASFLWIGDLAQPDTVLHISALSWIPIFNGNFNPMALVMAITMYISMSIIPQPQGVDNPMMKVMKIMPVLFLIFCYNFASALSLYWTMQNILSIVQMRYNLKQEPPTLEALKQQAADRKKSRKDRMKGFGMSARKKK